MEFGHRDTPKGRRCEGSWGRASHGVEIGVMPLQARRAKGRHQPPEAGGERRPLPPTEPSLKEWPHQDLAFLFLASRSMRTSFCGCEPPICGGLLWKPSGASTGSVELKDRHGLGTLWKGCRRPSPGGQKQTPEGVAASRRELSATQAVGGASRERAQAWGRACAQA